MNEQQVIVRGIHPVSKDEWDAIWRKAPHIDLRTQSAPVEEIKSCTASTESD